MRLSRPTLEAHAAETGFRPEVLEKVHLLLDLLEAINRHPFLGGRLALKGGTALNLFVFDVPRLSVDIDLNYIGSEDLESMLADRRHIEEMLPPLCRRLGLTPQTPTGAHAGISWSMRYASALGYQDNLKVDINFMYRVPLWPGAYRDSRPLAGHQVPNILVVDDIELVAGKLTALFARRTSRDLFDAHRLLVRYPVDAERLRLAFVVYGAMNIEDWRRISLKDLDPAVRDLDAYLLPLLRKGRATDPDTNATGWAEGMVSECREALSMVLPLRDNELLFLDRLLEEWQIEPEHLTTDEVLADRIMRQPMLLWKAQNVRKHRE
jgi:predicted nucleotidyltransferase component of viral defense system